MIDKALIGERKFNNFIKKIGIKARMKTLRTNSFEELATLKGDLFKLKCIEHIYDEFYDTYVVTDFKGLQ
jgi:hypothetical protein